MRKTACLIVAAVAGATLPGPAAAAERGYTVAGFDRIRATGPFEVTVRVGGPVSVRASGPQAVLDRLVVTSEQGVLTIRPERSDWSGWREWLGRGETLRVAVGVPSLRGVALAGSGDVAVDRARAPAFAASLAGSGDLTIGSVQADSIAIDLAGSGDVVISGRAKTGRATLAGSGDVRAAGLTVADATVSVAGSGNVALGASRTATVSLVGSGDVAISGTARCTVSRRGSGAVRCGG